jgi:hypothetical protein
MGRARPASYARSRTRTQGRNPVTGYRPMTLVDLASRLVRTAETKTRWKLVWEFLEEYRWEPEDGRFSWVTAHG